MNVFRLYSLARGAVVAVIVLGIGCTMRRVIPRQDWGALVGVEELTIVTLDGTRHDLDSFRFLTSGLVGQGAWSDIAIPLDSIALVEVREPNTAGTVFAALAVGTAVGVLIAQAQSPERPEASCPFVYSFNGKGYKFDSETFAGAVAPGLDRTDYDNLESLAPVGGSYRLRVTNERPETQYTDELRLLVVDHPLNTLAIPDQAGRVLVLRSPQTPVMAHDSRGVDATKALRFADGVYWRGAPPERTNLDDPSELRDVLTLKFERPTDALDARLMVRARNTGLAPFALRTFLGLQGEDLFSWYLRVARDGDLQRRIRGWVEREGMLHVWVMSGGGWVSKGLLPDVGPAIDKGQGLAFALDEAMGDTLVVKLESGRGLWEIDQVAIDVGAEPISTVTQVAPRRAVDERGRDVTALLAAPDGLYYATVEGAIADVEFDAPERPTEKMERSVILKSRGFYYIYVPHEGPNRSKLAERILDEPLLGNRYILEAWLRRRWPARSPL